MGDYYRQHCKQTTIAIVDKLGLTENQWNMTFQSRFGREEWLQPYTDHFLEEAASQGIQKNRRDLPWLFRGLFRNLRRN